MALEKFSKESKNVAKTEYNRSTKELFVTFKSFKNPSDTSTYRYTGVPEEVWEKLQQAESLGNFVNTAIKKGGYPYNKV